MPPWSRIQLLLAEEVPPTTASEPEATDTDGEVEDEAEFRRRYDYAFVPKPLEERADILVSIRSRIESERELAEPKRFGAASKKNSRQLTSSPSEWSMTKLALKRNIAGELVVTTTREIGA